MIKGSYFVRLRYHGLCIEHYFRAVINGKEFEGKDFDIEIAFQKFLKGIENEIKLEAR